MSYRDQAITNSLLLQLHVFYTKLEKDISELIVRIVLACSKYDLSPIMSLKCNEIRDLGVNLESSQPSIFYSPSQRISLISYPSTRAM